jgi:hypothetical protein
VALTHLLERVDRVVHPDVIVQPAAEKLRHGGTRGSSARIEYGNHPNQIFSPKLVSVAVPQICLFVFAANFFYTFLHLSFLPKYQTTALRRAAESLLVFRVKLCAKRGLQRV